MLGFWAREASFDAAKFVLTLSNLARKRAKGVVAICSRIGVALRSLKLSDEVTANWAEDLRAIADECPSIESINFHVEEYEHDGDDDDDDSEDNGYYREKRYYAPSDLSFNSFASLKNLSFTTSDVDKNFVRASASVFLSIPHSIERVVGLAAEWEREADRFETCEELEQFFSERPLLREVDLDDLCPADNRLANVFQVIAERCPLLKKITFGNNYINFHGIGSLESMKVFDVFRDASFTDSAFFDAELVAFCERSPLVEVLALRGYLCYDLRVPSLSALSALAELRELTLDINTLKNFSAAQVTNFIRDLAHSSGSSLCLLDLERPLALPTAALEALAARCLQLRSLEFYVCSTDATPASIRLLIDCIVADPIGPNGKELKMDVHVDCRGDEDDAFDRFEDLTSPTANLPAGVSLTIGQYFE